ncbi:MAG: hypothetical protein RL286_1045 [Bacteroidota bacterium]|jgi:hypothetical protein
MKRRKIYHVIEVCQKMIKTFPKQGHNKVTFNAMFYRNGKRLNSIDQAVIENFSPLVRSYDKSENPDKVKVEFKDVETGMLIWAKTFEWTDVDEELPKSLAGYAGLGEAEVNELVQRKFSEMERSRDLERLTSELQRVSALNEELEFQVQDMQNSLEAKKQVEYYSNIIGMALPGLAKFFTNSPVGTAFNFLAGTNEEKSIEKPLGDSLDSQRETILEMITTFVQTLDNQELGTIYLMLSEIEKDRSNIQKILQFITGSTTVETPIQTH